MNKISKDGKLAAIITHITIIGPVIAYFINWDDKDEFGNFYIRQSVGILCIFFVIGALVGAIPNAWAAYGFFLFVFILWIYSFSGALSNQYRLIPVVGKYFQKWFKLKRNNADK